MNDWTYALAAVSAFFAAVATVANLIQARRTAQANEVNVYVEMQKDYTSEQMRLAIAELARFWREQRGAFASVADAYDAEEARDPDAAKKLRGYSRLLSSYFLNVARLYETSLISRKLVRVLISRPGLNVFYEVAAPITIRRNKHHSSARYAAVLKKIVPRHGDGLF